MDTVLKDILHIPSPLQAFRFSFWRPKILIKRDDLIHPIISGNKWRKLKGGLKWAEQKGFTRWITFGGAFSNHVLAVSCLAHYLKISLTVYIRGEPHFLENPTLRKATSFGARIEFVPRHEFREFYRNFDFDTENAWVIPEGGSSKLSRYGIQEMMEEITDEVDLDKLHSLWVACGTGGTLGGIIRHIPYDLNCYGICAIKDKSIPHRIEQVSQRKLSSNIHLTYPFRTSGYRKLEKDEIDLAHRIFEESEIKLDPIYTIKLFCALDRFIRSNSLKEEDSILLIHTGGLQGLAGYHFIHNQEIYQL